MKVVGLRAEHHREPMGIGDPCPRLSWRVETAEQGWAQTAYEISVATEGRPDEVCFGQIRSPEQILVPWPAPPMTSRERRAVRVRVWGGATGGTEPSAWSDPLVIEAGLLRPQDWAAQMIAAGIPLPAQADGPAVLLRREFEVAEEPVSARLYVSAHGVYEIELNGLRATQEVMAPGWTSYHHRLRYQTCDVTGLIRSGGNAIGGWLADGWYRGRLGYGGGRRAVYGDQTGLLAQLEISCADGSTLVVATGEGWRASAGPVLSTGLYDGERYDARLEQPGWSAPGFDDTSWPGVVVCPFDSTTLVAPSGPPVRRVEQLRPVDIVTTPAGRTIVDFGQNITGRVRIRVQGEPGRTIQLRHAEVLEDGELCTRPLRGAQARDEYTLRGGGPEEWEPRFTLHGFRYAEVRGWPGAIGSDDITAVVCHSDMRRTGWFECSDPLLNRLHDNIVWSMRGNFVDIPTDCPQRDERLGWTGDLAVFAPTAAFLYDCAGMLISWLADLALEQAGIGTVPFYVPWLELNGPAKPAAVWGDAAVAAPWAVYERFADPGILRAQYPSMLAWVEQVAGLAGESRLWDKGFQFGDWLDPAAPPDQPAAARTDPHLIATAYHARSARTLAQIAALLGEEADHRRYTTLASEVGEAFADEFVTPSGRLASDAQTAYAVAITCAMLEKADQRERAGRRLVELVQAQGHQIGTGFVGTPLICDALTAAGADDTAYHLLLQRTCPSWLYQVIMGATTVWERWDSLLPDGSVNPGDMTSFNHYALGAVADWLHRSVAGLAPAAPGYRRVLVRPRPGGGLTRARATHDSPYGRIDVVWQRSGNRLDITLCVPPGVTALVQLPAESFDPVEVGAGQHSFSCLFREVSQDPPAPDTPGHPITDHRPADRK